tara:strand:+ start:287 stop:2071 length:1785 start_codon:yes stop_codon:yes gene_type:complete
VRASKLSHGPLCACAPEPKFLRRPAVADTTLRDGEQSPGATLSEKEKVDIAAQLSRLGVDVCEAGFPIASNGDFEAVRQVAKTAGMMTEGRDGGVPMRIAGLSRANKKDIERCYDAVRHAELNRIHTFLASSDIHLEHKLGISRAECLKLSAEMVTFAKSLCEDIEFSPEDAGRSDPAFLVELCGAVIEAGATTINLPDTVGYTLPDEYANIFSYCIDKTKGAENIIWSTHCHNDLGLATANSLAAVQAGARQVEVTLNSLGERAGNTSLEEVVMALKTRPQHYPVHCTINTQQIMRTSRMVSKYTGIAVQANKAIVGKNAFAHESGIHQHGMLKNASTYEIMTPESVGADSSGMLVLGKHSGKAAYKSRLIELGYADVAADEEQLRRLVDGAKAVADQKKTVSDEDLEALLGETLYSKHEDTWLLESLNVQTDSKDSGSKVTATATVKLRDASSGDEAMEAAIGVGPVDATFKAIGRISKRPVTLTSYTITKIHGGSDEKLSGNDALASVTLHIQERGGEDVPDVPDDFPGHHGAVFRDASTGSDDHLPKKSKPGARAYSGNGTSTDIIVASAKAYLDALNRMIDAKRPAQKA